MNNLPKPLIIGAAAVLVLVALFLAFRAVKGGGGDGDYNKGDIERAVRARTNQPNEGRTQSSPSQK